MRLSPNIELTSTDYPGKLAFIAYTVGCNYRCPTCHSKPLSSSLPESITGEEAITRIKKYPNFDWLNGLVICGGEPTIHSDLPEFLRNLKKELKLPIKLDTNGTQSRTLGELIQNKLVDYIAMDIKAPPSLYGRVIGFENESALDIASGLEQSMAIIQNAPNYEFRTTLVPVYRDPNKKTFGWMTPQEIQEMRDWTGKNVSNPEKTKWYVQKFVAREKESGAMIDDKFVKENLPSEYHETPLRMLESARDILRKRFPNAQVR